MNANTKEFKEDTIKQINQKLFGAFLHWEKPTIRNEVGPYKTDEIVKFAGILGELISESTQKLELCSIEDLQEVLYENGNLNKDILLGWKEFPYNKILKLCSYRPLWFQSGFGNEDYKADYNYWSKMPSFSLDEATCLTIDFEPKHFDEKLFTAIAKDACNYSHIPEFFFKRKEQIDRNFYLSYHNQKVSFEELYKWVKLIELEVPKEFLTSFQRIANRSKNQGDAIKPERFDNREKASLAQLLTALAISEYGFVPSDARSPIPKEIQDMCAKLGLEISDDTIRKYLKLDASFLPDDWQDK